MIEIVPAIIPKSFADLEEKVGLVYSAAKLIQVDICDGKFVPNQSWPFVEDNGEFAKIVKEEKGLPRWEDTDYEVHLMTDTPNDEAADWIRAGAVSIIVHIEAGSDAVEDIISEWGQTVDFSLALKMGTPVSVCAAFLTKVKTIQLMGIGELGFQGQAFDDKVLEKIRGLRKLAPGHSIAVDGGVNLENAREIIKAGATKLVIGSAIIDAGLPGEAIKDFQKLAESFK